MKMPATKTTRNGTVEAALIQVHLCVPEDQLRHLPKRRRAPESLPLNAPVPRQGDVIYLSRTSAWGVQLVVHDWRAPDELHVEVWLRHVGSTQQLHESGFAPLLPQ